MLYFDGVQKIALESRVGDSKIQEGKLPRLTSHLDSEIITEKQHLRIMLQMEERGSQVAKGIREQL